MTRSEALRRGLARYNTGKPCVWGHLSPRRTNNGVCIECERVYAVSSQRKASRRARSALLKANPSLRAAPPRPKARQDQSYPLDTIEDALADALSRLNNPKEKA